MAQNLSYGPHPDQKIEIQLPEGTEASRAAGTAVLVHGGYWRPAFTSALMAPLAADLVSRGWVVANVEYRRGRGAGGLEATLEDAATAIGLAARTARAEGWAGPVVSIGHSVGGQLVLLHPEAVDAVVALAPVTDLARTRAERLGDDAVEELIPQTPQELPDLYRRGSALEHVPVGRPLLVVHGDVDDRVPPAHTETYVRAARAAGDEVELRVVPGGDHRGLIDPSGEGWAFVLEWLAARASADEVPQGGGSTGGGEEHRIP